MRRAGSSASIRCSRGDSPGVPFETVLKERRKRVGRRRSTHAGVRREKFWNVPPHRSPAHADRRRPTALARCTVWKTRTVSRCAHSLSRRELSVAPLRRVRHRFGRRSPACAGGRRGKEHPTSWWRRHGFAMRRLCEPGKAHTRSMRWPSGSPGRGEPNSRTRERPACPRFRRTGSPR